MNQRSSKLGYKFGYCAHSLFDIELFCLVSCSNVVWEQLLKRLDTIDFDILKNEMLTMICEKETANRSFQWKKKTIDTWFSSG